MATVIAAQKRITAQVLETIEHLRSGAAMTLSEALRKSGLAHKHFKQALMATRELAELYDEAIQESYDLLADRLVHIDEYYANPKVANGVSANIRWYLARKKPSTYGDHSSVEHRITADKDVLEALMRSKARAQTIEYEAPKALPHPTHRETQKERNSPYFQYRDARNRQDVEDIPPVDAERLVPEDEDISVLL